MLMEQERKQDNDMVWPPTQPPHPQQHVPQPLQAKAVPASLCLTAPDGLVILVLGVWVVLKEDTSRVAEKDL